MTTLAAPCTLPRGIGSQLMQDAVTQLVVNLVTSLSNSPLSGGRKGQPAIMTTSFIQEKIDMALNDLMLELSKQLTNIVKPMIHNEIPVAQKHANTKDNSTLAMPLENMASENALANQLGDNLSSHQIGNMDK